MSAPTMMLFTDVLPPSAPPVYLPAAARAIYLREGSAHLESDTATQHLDAESGMVTDGQLTIRVGSEGARIWRWELVGPEQAENSQALRSAPAATSELAVSAEFELDPRFRWLMRLDSVTFPPGGTAWTHNHQGPGLRMCRNGEITIETEGTRNTYRPGEAWAEKGVLPVLAPTTPDESTTFVRCFLLPQHNRGASSFRVVLPEDREKPNTQNYHVISERLLETLY